MDETPSQPPPEQMPVSDAATVVPPPVRKKYFWPAVSGVLVLVFIALIGISYTLFTNMNGKKSGSASTTARITPAPYTISARVGYLTGNAWKIVNYRRTELLEGDIVTEGDEIITEKDARVVLSFDEGSVVRISDNAQIVLSQLIPSSMVLKNQKGIVYARVKKDPEHLFAVKAKTYTVTSMGTSFSVENQDEVKVKVYESRVQISDDASTATRAGKPTEVTQMQQWQEKRLTPVALNDTDVAGNSFLAWSLQEDKLISSPAATPGPAVTKPQGSPSPGSGTDVQPKVTTAPAASPIPPAPTLPAAQVTSIILKGQKIASNTAGFTWTVAGSSSGGFRIIWATSSGPSFPLRDGDLDHYYPDTDKADDEVGGLQSGKTYYFRVCEMRNGACGVYSNEITLTF